MTYSELSPRVLGIQDVNLKSATTYDGNALDVSDCEQVLFAFVVDNTGGGGNGLAKLTLDFMLKNGTILSSVDVLTSINTKVDNTAFFAIDRILGTDEFGTATLGSDTDLFKFATFIKPHLTVTEANNGTTCTGSLRAIVRRS